MLVCDECGKRSDEVPLAVRGIVYTGPPEEYIVISVLCKKCDLGEAGKQATIKIEKGEKQI